MFANRTRWNLQENALHRELIELRASGKQIFDLTRSNPTECGFAYNSQEIQRAFARDQIVRYEPHARGLESARSAVAGYYEERGANISGLDLVLSSGTSEGYSFIFRLLCNPGDEVLIPSPGYPLFEFLADLCDVKLVHYPLIYDHGWQVDFSSLSTACTQKTRAIIVVNPNNPTGHYSVPDEQAQIRRFCVERNIAIIADEVFFDFGLTADRRQSFAAAGDALTFTLSGLSKICGLPQMKLAWIAVSGPAKLKQEALARLEVIADAYLSVGTPVQLAAPDLLATGGNFRAQAMARVRSNLAKLDSQLAAQSVCSRFKCEGGWSAVLRVPAQQTDEELAIALIRQHGVSVHPGHFYDFPRNGHIVVSLIVPDQEFAQGTKRVLSHFA